MNIVPATQEMAVKFLPPKLPLSLRGYCLINDEGEPLALVGFIRRNRKTMILFIDAKDEAFDDKRMVVKMCRMMLDIADRNDWTLIAIPDDTKPTSRGFIEHYGFELNEQGEYIRWPV